DKDTQRLLYACRNCIYQEETKNYCVYEMKFQPLLVKDIAADPSLATQSRRSDTKRNINCGYRWTDFDNNNTGFNVLEDEEYDDQDYQGVSNQLEDPSYEDPSYPTDNIESEAIDTNASQYEHNQEDW
ncbi:29840_t:CDS:2, partial [Gigaspora margarita]